LVFLRLLLLIPPFQKSPKHTRKKALEMEKQRMKNMGLQLQTFGATKSHFPFPLKRKKEGKEEDIRNVMQRQNKTLLEEEVEEEEQEQEGKDLKDQQEEGKLQVIPQFLTLPGVEEEEEEEQTMTLAEEEESPLKEVEEEEEQAQEEKEKEEEP
jgi:hypothetical protein